MGEECQGGMLHTIWAGEAAFRPTGAGAVRGKTLQMQAPGHERAFAGIRNRENRGGWNGIRFGSAGVFMPAETMRPIMKHGDCPAGHSGR
jgi:hypothetical protein